MSERGRWDDDDGVGQGNRPRHDGSDSVGWRDTSETGDPISGGPGTGDESPGAGRAEAGGVRQDRTEELDALERAIELLVGPAEPIDERVGTYVTELPQWFQRAGSTEARVRVGDETFTSGAFPETADPLTAEARTRIGTRISVTVASTDPPSGGGQQAWSPAERELVSTLVALVKSEVDQWEFDSLKRVSDGVVALDAELQYTYVNRQAEQILGRDGDELRGEYIWDIFPEAAGTIAQERIETALETQTPTSFEQYRSRTEQWIEARICPSDNGVVVAFTDITGVRTAEREFEQVLEATPAGIVLLTDEGEIVRANTRAEELLGLDRSEIEGRRYDRPDWDIWDENGDAIPPDDHPVTHAITSGETVQGFTHGITLPDGTDRWLSSNVTPIFDGAGSVEQVVVALEDVTVLKRLEQLIETFQPVNEVLNAAATRRETEETICELLTGSRQYQYARIGERDPGTALTESSIQSRSETVSADESVALPVRSQTELGPTRAAVETGEIQTVTSGSPDPRFEEWREYTREQGFQGGAIVPLDHGGRVYGLLTLYTERGDAFGEREQMLLATLGDRIGQVLHTLETERVVHTDAVAELTFRSTDQDSFFVAASKQLGCQIEVVGTIPASEGTLVCYVHVRGAPLDAIGEVATNADAVTRSRQIRQAESPPGGTIEIELGQSLAGTLMTMGAVVTADTVTNGRAEVVCEVPLGHDIDSLVAGLTGAFPETTLVAKREYNPAARTAEETSSQVLADVFRDELTDRQRQVLRAAMHAGYFESPRKSTATEIADALSLTQSTVSYHLRKAQGTLFEAMLDRL